MFLITFFIWKSLEQAVHGETVTLGKLRNGLWDIALVTWVLYYYYMLWWHWT